MRRFGLVTALVLVVAACGDSGTTGTTGEPTGSTAATATTTEAGGTTEVAPTGEGAGQERDCLQLWPETRVQAITERGFAFFEANEDFSACTYLDGSAAIALAWRDGDRNDFDLSKAGAGAAAVTIDVDVCDGGFLIAIGDATSISAIVMEGYSENQGRVYTATVSGLEAEVANDWAVELIAAVC